MNRKEKHTPRRLSDVPKPVRERWASLKRRKWARQISRAYMRWKLPRTERARKRTLEETFEALRYWAARYEDSRMSGVKTLLNIGLYLLIADRDIQALKIDALTHPDEWTRKLCARVILLTIYEWDADEVSGRRLHEALCLMQSPDSLKQEIVCSLRRLRKIQERAKKEFTDIRNTAIAHRDPNALKQYRAIRDLNVRDVWNIAMEFFSEINRFISVLTRLMHAGNNLDSYLRQWSAGAKAEAN